MNWYIMALKRFGDFGGRSRRKEFWMFTLFLYIFAIPMMIIDYFTGWKFTTEISPSYGVFYLVYALVFFAPNLAVSVRRLQDTDRSGWMFLLIFIPIIGQIWLIILFSIDGTPGRNQYGKDPKEIQEQMENL